MGLAWLVATAWPRDPDPPLPRAVTAQKLHDCRDLCEQNGIVEQLPEKVVKACQARCAKDTPPPPYEPIRRITVAPADHSRTIRDLKR